MYSEMENVTKNRILCHAFFYYPGFVLGWGGGGSIYLRGHY